MTRENDHNDHLERFEARLAESLGGLARAAPGGPDVARVFAALRRRQIVRSAAAAGAICVLLAGAATLWRCWPDAAKNQPGGHIARPTMQIALPQARRDALASIMPAMPALAFDAPAVAMTPSAVRMEVQPLSALGWLRGPTPPGAINCHMPSLSLALWAGTPKQTTNERTLQ